MKAIIQLQMLGYKVELKGKRIKLKWAGDSQPDSREVCPLLEEVKANKPEAVDYLSRQELGEAKPFLKSDGTLVIRFDCHPKYRWWVGGQSIADTLAELGVSEEIWEAYSGRPYPKEIN